MPIAFGRLLNLHVPVTGPASSRRRQMRSGSQMLRENPPPAAVPRCLLLFSTVRSQSAASPGEKTRRRDGCRIWTLSCPRREDGSDLGIAPWALLGLQLETCTRCWSRLGQPLCTLRQHQTKLHSPAIHPEKGIFWHITSPGSALAAVGSGLSVMAPSKVCPLRLRSHLLCLNFCVKALLVFVIKPTGIKQDSVSITCKTLK